jgi:hypothetical protein
MEGRVIPLRPRSAGRVDYERIVSRIDVVRREWSRLFAIQSELERQFVENDLREAPAPGDDPKPLSTEGRRRRLDELLKIHHRTQQLVEAEWHLWRIAKAIEMELLPQSSERG